MCSFFLSFLLFLSWLSDYYCQLAWAWPPIFYFAFLGFFFFFLSGGTFTCSNTSSTHTHGLVGLLIVMLLSQMHPAGGSYRWWHDFGRAVYLTKEETARVNKALVPTEKSPLLVDGTAALLNTCLRYLDEPFSTRSPFSRVTPIRLALSYPGNPTSNQLLCIPILVPLSQRAAGATTSSPPTHGCVALSRLILVRF